MSRYQQDPNDSTKQVPKGVFSYENASTAIIPPELVVQKRPSSILVNKVGSYKFLYTTTGSVGTTVDELTGAGGNWITGSILTADGPQELPIQPVAWAKCNEDAVLGDITFIYRGGA